jgi:molybdopterin/thiamine biosynthesis adenylyltransferase
MDTNHIKPFKFCTPDHWLRRPVEICLIGVGGRGSEVLTSLARIDYTIRELGHPGLHMTAWDGDVVERPNIGRQAFYFADLGHNKALVSIHRISITSKDVIGSPCLECSISITNIVNGITIY